MELYSDFSSLCDIPIIDGHIHFRDVDQIDHVPMLMEKCGIERWNALCTLNGYQTTNPWGFYIKSVFPKSTYLFSTFDLSVLAPDVPKSIAMAPEEQTEIHMNMGCHGVKLLQGKPTVYRQLNTPLSDSVYRGFFSFMEARGFPILWHVADPEEFWDKTAVPVWAVKHGWAYTDGGFPEKEDLYAEIDRVLDSFPNLVIIFAHFYFLSADLERAGRFLDNHPSISFDLTPGVEMYHNFTSRIDETRDFFIRYQDRIIFGTDTMDSFFADRDMGRKRIKMVRRWLETDDVFSVPSDPIMTPDDRPELRGCNLPRDILQKIYRSNFENIAGPVDKPVLFGDLIRECERSAHLAASLRDRQGEEIIKAILKKIG